MTKYFLLVIALACLFFGLCCKEQATENTKTTENKMYVYSNFGKTFYLVDYKTFEVVREIQLNIADTISCDGMALSTNRDYLFFGAQGPFPDPPSGFAIYNIKKDKLENFYFTKLNYGIGYFIAAENNSEPGLVYAHFRDYGTYSIDLFEQKVKELVNNEHDFTLDKRIYHSPDGKWTVVKKNWESTGYTELEFYTATSGLHELQFVLNKENHDSLRVYDFAFSKDNKLLIMYLPGPIRDTQAYFGSYDLTTKQLYRSSLKFSWSLSGYYLAYSANRNEVYAIGSNGQFYIINSETYLIKDSISLLATNEQMPILIRPDDNIAFVNVTDNSIFVIDLNSRQVIKTITATKPYTMIIP